MNAISAGRLIRWRPAATLMMTCLWVGISATPLWADGPDVDGSLDYTELSLADLIELDVVTGASRYEQKTSEAPASVTVVTAEVPYSLALPDAAVAVSVTVLVAVVMVSRFMLPPGRVR